MAVRGAPAIGMTGAYGLVLAAKAARPQAANWQDTLADDIAELANARPTAVNLRWAIERLCAITASDTDELLEKLEADACAIQEEEWAANAAMSRHGADLIAPASRVITHCNTGTLATSGAGTALGVIRYAHRDGKLAGVYADETRPWLQGARLTMWELQQEGIPVQLICDGAAAAVCASPGVDWVIVGSDRITANGDVINKIGTYSLAVVARHHGARVMVVAPLSTFDPHTETGAEVEIEQRAAEEVSEFGGRRHTPEGIAVHNPAFDVTPAELVDVIVTERGVIRQPNRQSVLAHLGIDD